MARWLFCQSCQQWSKSTTALSGDGSCPLCSNPFINAKPLQDKIPHNTVSSEDVQNNIETPAQKATLYQPYDKLESAGELNIPQIPETNHEERSVDTLNAADPLEKIAVKTVEQCETIEETQTVKMEDPSDALESPELMEDVLEDEEEVPDIPQTGESAESIPAQDMDVSKISKQHESYMELRRRKRRTR